MPPKNLDSRAAISVILVLQLIPLLLFPAESFSGSTQEWWLPAILALLVVIGDIALIVQHSEATWPWKLIAFAQGFNIISRLMMVYPHATINVEGRFALNTPYLLLSLVAMVASAFMLWYIDRPVVRTGLMNA